MLHVSITTQANINEKFGYFCVVAVILNACHLVGLINLFYGGKITIAFKLSITSRVEIIISWSTNLVQTRKLEDGLLLFFSLNFIYIAEDQKVLIE